MAAQVIDAPLTVAQASLAEKAAHARVVEHQHNHDRLRHRLSIRATNRARAEWGLAFGELIDAIVALARAMDDRDPRQAAMACDGRWVLFSRDTSGHEQCDQTWGVYQEARRSNDRAAIDSARDDWRDSLVA